MTLATNRPDVWPGYELPPASLIPTPALESRCSCTIVNCFSGLSEGMASNRACRESVEESSVSELMVQLGE